jgi:hypothetical protein
MQTLSAMPSQKVCSSSSEICSNKYDEIIIESHSSEFFNNPKCVGETYKETPHKKQMSWKKICIYSASFKIR